MSNHPKFPKSEIFLPQRHQGKRSYSIFRVHIRLIYINMPRSQPIDDMPWDDGYHNSYIDVKVAGGMHEAKHVALTLAYLKYNLSHDYEFQAWKAQLIKRRCGAEPLRPNV